MGRLANDRYQPGDRTFAIPWLCPLARKALLVIPLVAVAITKVLTALSCDVARITLVTARVNRPKHFLRISLLLGGWPLLRRGDGRALHRGWCDEPGLVRLSCLGIRERFGLNHCRLTVLLEPVLHLFPSVKRSVCAVVVCRVIRG